MTGAIFKRLRSFITVCVGLSLLPLAVVTLVLLFCTGKPIANRSRSHRELGFRPGYPFDLALEIDDDTETPGVIFSRDVRFFAQGNPVHDELKPSSLMDAQIFDTLTLEKLGKFPGELDYFGFEVSPDRKLVALVGRADQGSGFTIGELATGKMDRIEVKNTLISPRCVFAPNSRDLLILNYMGSPIHYDLKERRTVSVLPMRPDRDDILAFFDNRGQAKVLAKSSQYEILDVDSNKIDTTLDLSDLSRQAFFDPEDTEANPHFSYAAGQIAIAHDGIGVVSVNSIEDGRTLGLYRIPPTGVHDLRMTPDGRFLICRYVKRGAYSNLEYWLNDYFPFVTDDCRFVLIDLKTNRTWPEIQGAEPFVFDENASRLVTFTIEERFEYDVPPPWQYCDPLAWIALGIWVSLLVCWLRLRNGRRPSSL